MGVSAVRDWMYGVQNTTPKLSAVTAVRNTVEVYQPLVPSVPPVTSSAPVGAVLSSFTVTDFVETRPAWFRHVPVTMRPAVSVLMTGIGSHTTGPLIESVPEARRVTFTFDQPAAFGAPVRNV